MDVGVQMIFQNYRGRSRDEEVVAAEMHTAARAEALGFAKLWPVEHHFTDYAACPDNAEFLAWVAAKTDRIGLGTGAFILPWNDPLRVAEKIVLLDHLSNGRAVLGFGRGLARCEYAGFGVDMSESRARFDEAAAMILDALDSGFIEGDGPYYPQARTAIRPRPLRGFRDRLYAVGMSPESVEQAAKLGARLMVFSQMPWESFATGTLVAYRETFERTHGRPAPPVLTVDLMYCDEDAARAEAVAAEHMAAYYLSVLEHYEIRGEHFKAAKGYEMYAAASEVLRRMDVDEVARGYVTIQSGGTPQRILESLARRRELLGDFELSIIVNYGGLPFDAAARSMETFARGVLPELREW
jgi:alkanesulfonate monooxygenase SsuD/methylene tetrahydromethanopterin reductase-like flavin-dependent oxidoreductase (luciferase family)